MGLESVFGIGGKIVNGAFNYAKKNPKKITGALLGTTIGGLLLNNLLNKSKEDYQDLSRQIVLTNPYLNPTGCFRHIINPFNTEPDDFDNPILKHLISRQQGSVISEKNTLADSEYVKQGLMQIVYNNNLERVIETDNGSIEIYSDKNGKIVGSIRKDKSGVVQNFSLNEPYISVNLKDNGEIKSVYYNNPEPHCTQSEIKEFYENGGKGLNFDT